jgi:hypothetical protein
VSSTSSFSLSRFEVFVFWAHPSFPSPSRSTVVSVKFFGVLQSSRPVHSVSSSIVHYLPPINAKKPPSDLKTLLPRISTIKFSSSDLISRQREYGRQGEV